MKTQATNHRDLLQRLRRFMAAVPARTGKRIPVLLHHGVARAGGGNATLLITGHAFGPRYFSQRFFAGPPRIEPVTSVPVWRLAATLDECRARADLTIACVDHHSARRHFGRDWLAVPGWVASDIELPVEAGEIASFRKRLKQRTRQYRSQKLTIEESTKASDLPEFYERYYTPTSRSRHGDLAGVRRLWKMRWRFRHEGRLLWAVSGGERVAGAMILRLGEAVKLECLGILDGREDLLKQGGISALYAAAIEYALRSGSQRMLLGNSRPSLHDGVLNFKRNWGAVVREDPNVHHDLLMRWDSWQGVVAEFLSHTSIIHREGGALSALWSLPGGLSADQRLFDRQYAMIRSPGLRCVRLLAVGEKPHNLALPSEMQWIDVRAACTGSSAFFDTSTPSP